MIEELRKYLEDKSILLLGFGREGKSSYQFIRKLFPEKRLSIADFDKENIDALKLKDEDVNVDVFLGKDYLYQLDNHELILKSPGIYLSNTFKKVSSQTDLFLRFFGDKTIGVTGTKGKSTTSSLIHHILKNSSRDALLVGNIGHPPFNFIDQINDNTSIVFELSSHQLNDIQSSPAIAVFLNIFPEHLDYYPDIESYENAKSNIFKYFNPDGVQIFNADQEKLKKYLNPSIAKSQTFSYSLKEKSDCYFQNDEIILSESGQDISLIHKNKIKNLIGEHNIQNIMAAALACKQKKLSNDEIREGIISFKTLEHRLEYVGCFRGIHFYNDSIATIPEASIMALKSIPGTDTLLLGGFDRGLDYSELYQFINSSSDLRNIIFIGPAGKRMHDEFLALPRSTKNCLFVNSLQEAFTKIPNITKAGKACVLSPAAASYDSYKNFEERGADFKKIAGNL